MTFGYIITITPSSITYFFNGLSYPANGESPSFEKVPLQSGLNTSHESSNPLDNFGFVVENCEALFDHPSSYKDNANKLNCFTIEIYNVRPYKTVHF